MREFRRCILDTEIRTLNLKNKLTFEKWQNFLKSLDITNFVEAEILKLDTTLGIYDENQELVAVGSAANDVLKYIGVCNKNVEKGSRFNKIVSALMNERAQNGIFHLFVFTKPEYILSFEHVGFNLLAQVKQGGILETGDDSIQEYLDRIPQVADQNIKKVAGIVMNANPFTQGHRYLVEQAAKENDLVYVFVVKNDVSLFSAQERIQLVRKGTADLKNVQVVFGDDYMVSYATFPAYFLPTAADIIDYQTKLDAQIFKTWIAPKLNIKRRYLGDEPFSKTTQRYNQALKKELPPTVEVKIISRKTNHGKIITATQVRKWIAENRIENVHQFVPRTTDEFIRTNLKELQDRIMKGMSINGN